MTAESAPTEWVPHSPEVLKIALAAFLARVRGNERHAAMLIADAGHRGLSYQVLESTWWLLEQFGQFVGDEKKQAKLEADILKLAGWEDLP
ncbi:hypothetical protein [Mycolicibacterium elephantis]